jgi:minor extracellular serine protease Vpr
VNVTLRFLSALLVSAAIACGQASAPSSNAAAAAETAPALSSSSAGSDETPTNTVRGAFVDAKAALKATAEPRPDEMVTVVVELDAPAVAAVQAQSPDKHLDEQASETIAASLRKQQQDLRGMIEVQGGTIQSTYQHALNGIRVRLPASKLGALTLMPGVKSVRHVAIYQQDNVLSVPYIGAPTIWKGPPGYHGEGIKVAVIDTGIDYTHANFAGPGTASAYNAAHGGPAGTPGTGDATPANAAFFGPNAPKVKGGTDLVGDTYDANPNNPTYQPIPHPDTNPLDCAGHGSHVAGTVAGFGVTSAGATFNGSYDDTTDADPAQWKVGPGVAPKADLYAVRVFGCAGSTDVVTDAINWAVANHMDVINMSLGAAYGTEDSADAIASTNAEEAGTIVVASAGNSGNVPYIVGSPSTGAKTISVAAIDSHQTWPGAVLKLTPTGSINAQWSNQSSLAPALPTDSQPVDVLRNGDGSISLGCSESQYGDIETGTSHVSGTMVVAARGTCARVYRVQAAFRWGALSAALINNSTGYPTFEGDIPICTPGAKIEDVPPNANGRPCAQPVPSSGTCPFSDQVKTGSGAAARCVETPRLVTIPFFGVQGPATGTTESADSKLLKASTFAQVTGQTAVNNPTKNQITSFSSAGPRQSYSAEGLRSAGGHLKPNVAAPGASVFSTAVGTGTDGEYLSGTSMAAPHTTGLVALALQAHAGAFDRDDVRLAVENTADPTRVVGWRPRLAGAGLIQAVGAVTTQTVLQADTDDGSNLSFGVVELLSDYSRTRTMMVRNLSGTPATFTTSSTKWVSGSNRTHTLTIQEPSVTVAPGHAARLHVTLSVPAASAGNSGLVADSFSPYAGSSGSMREVGGYITLTPTTDNNGVKGNNGVSLTMPYYFVPRARAAVVATVGRLDKNNSTESVVQNFAAAPLSSFVDYFAWGASGHANLGPHGIRAVGVKTMVDRVNPADRNIVFAINTFKPNSTYVGRIRHQVDITFEGNRSGTPDIRAFTDDIDAVLFGTATGRVGVIVIDYHSVGGVCAGSPAPCAFGESVAAAPTDGSTILMPLWASDIGISATNPRFTYTVKSVFFQDDPRVTPTSTPITDTTPPVSFDAYDPSLTTSVTSPTGGTLPLTLAPGGQARVMLTIKPSTLGVMIVPSDNASDRQALLFRLRDRDDDADREGRWSAAR